MWKPLTKLEGGSDGEPGTMGGTGMAQGRLTKARELLVIAADGSEGETWHCCFIPGSGG